MIYTFEDRSAGIRRRLLAFTLGLMLHAGAIYAALAPSDQPIEEFDDASGPIAIELAPMAVAPPSEKLDLPVGPRAEETPPAPLTPQKTEVAKAEEAPALPTTPYEPDDPELRMAKPNPVRNDNEQVTDDTAVEKVEQPSVAPAMAVPETTAPPPADAPPAPVAAAQQIGMSESDKKIVARWQRQVVVHLNQFKRYPADARRRRDQGDVHLAFTIDRSGRVMARDLRSGSGSASLDAAALELLERAAPLPQPPPQIAGAAVELSLPVEYRMKD